MSNSPPEQPVAQTIKEGQVDQQSGRLVTEAAHGRGAFLSIVHKDRSVDGYIVAETDLEIVYHSSWLVEFGLFVATSCLGFAIGLYKDIILTVDAPEAAVQEANLIYWICGFCGSLGLILAIWQIIRRHRKVNEIKGIRSLFARLKVLQWISRLLMTPD